ncbi:MAG: G5 domain-containing protein [Firmicutes bacterium]|nr:G5 domain-containing protein [Bacillota bacterium]
MKRRVYVITLIMIVAIMCLLSGCGGSDKSGSAASTSNAASGSEAQSEANQPSEANDAKQENDEDNENVGEADAQAASVKIKIIADGKTQEVEVSEGTVEDALKSAAVTIGKDDIVSPDLKSKLSKGVEIVVTRVTFEEAEETVEVAYETEYVPDDTIYEGSSYYVQTGINGETVNKYRITYHDGNEVAREIVSTSEKVLTQNEIIAYGTLVYVAPEEGSGDYSSEGSSGSGEEEPEICVPNDDNWD